MVLQRPRDQQYRYADSHGEDFQRQPQWPVIAETESAGPRISVLFWWPIGVRKEHEAPMATAIRNRSAPVCGSPTRSGWTGCRSAWSCCRGSNRRRTASGPCPAATPALPPTCSAIGISSVGAMDLTVLGELFEREGITHIVERLVAGQTRGLVYAGPVFPVGGE